MTGLQISITNTIGQSNKSEIDLNTYILSEDGLFLVSEADSSKMIVEE